MNLIVRVKRRRSQNPSDSLWIADDAGVPSKKKSTRQLTASLQALSTSINDDDQEKLASGNKKLFLQRIQTVEIGVESELDKSALSDCPSSEAITLPAPVTALEAGNDDPSSMWITSSKKVLRSSYTLEKFVVVDVTQIPFSRPSTTYSRSLTGERILSADDSASKRIPSSVSKRSAVIDPATRKLDAAIEKAFKLNDFNEMAQALQIGIMHGAGIALSHNPIFVHVNYAVFCYCLNQVHAPKFSHTTNFQNSHDGYIIIIYQSIYKKVLMSIISVNQTDSQPSWWLQCRRTTAWHQDLLRKVLMFFCWIKTADLLWIMLRKDTIRYLSFSPHRSVSFVFYDTLSSNPFILFNSPFLQSFFLF